MQAAAKSVARVANPKAPRAPREPKNGDKALTEAMFTLLGSAWRGQHSRSTDARSALEAKHAELTAWASSLPSIAEYERRTMRELVPAYNAANDHMRLCSECGRAFALRDGNERRSQTCSEACSKRRRGETMDKVAEVKANKTTPRRAWDRHQESCPECGRGRVCAVGRRLLDEATVLQTGDRPKRYDENRHAGSREEPESAVEGQILMGLVEQTRALLTKQEGRAIDGLEAVEHALRKFLKTPRNSP